VRQTPVISFHGNPGLVCPTLTDELSAVVVGRVEGYDDYSEEYQAHVREQFHKLLKMRDEL
jgi:hypothetical protein